jgi:hypothetical protein
VNAHACISHNQGSAASSFCNATSPLPLCDVIPNPRAPAVRNLLFRHPIHDVIPNRRAPAVRNLLFRHPIHDVIPNRVEDSVRNLLLKLCTPPWPSIPGGIIPNEAVLQAE